MTELVRVRGRVAAKVRIAWLEVDGRWQCSVASPGFDLVRDDGTRVRIDVDPRTSWTQFERRFTGPWSELEDFDGEHPFRGRAVTGAVVYTAFEIDGGRGVEIWGEPHHEAVATGYRDVAPGPLAAVHAIHARRFEVVDERIEPLSKRWFAGCAAALVVAIAAPWSEAPFVLLRAALLGGLACLRMLHREASPYGPSQGPPRFATGRALLRTWFWSYLTIGDVLPISPWLTWSVSAILACIAGWWAIETRRRRSPVRALLSDQALDGIVANGHVRTASATLAPAQIAITWTHHLADWQQIAIAEMSSVGLERDAGDLARVAQTDAGWLVIQSHDAAIVATLRRALAWDRVMVAAYAAFALAALAFAVRVR